MISNGEACIVARAKIPMYSNNKGGEPGLIAKDNLSMLQEVETHRAVRRRGYITV
jgi:hypothetical protein